MHAPTFNQPRQAAALVAAAALFFSGPVFAQTQPPASDQTPVTVDQTVVRKYLTDARNSLSDLTELPAATQLTGEPRARVQQLITNFNELITKTTDWRASYEKVESILSSLLAAEPAPDSGTPGAVGTTGTTAAIDRTVRAKLIEFGTHLEQFKVAASGGTPSTEPEVPNEPPAPAPPDAPPTTAADEPPDNPPVDPDVAERAEAADIARDIALHVEAIEVILGSQASAQRAAVAAAGGAVVTSPTPSGSNRTTVTSPDVTLNDSQLDQIRTHLAEIRRLIEKKQ